jgi:hypothetical protein
MSGFLLLRGWLGLCVIRGWLSFCVIRSWLSFCAIRRWLSFCVARSWLCFFLLRRWLCFCVARSWLCSWLSFFLLRRWLSFFMLLFLRVCRSNRSKQQDQNSGANNTQCFHLYFLHHQFQAPAACRVGRCGSDPNLLLRAKPLLGALNTTAHRLRATYPANCSLLHSFPCCLIQPVTEACLSAQNARGDFAFSGYVSMTRGLTFVLLQLRHCSPTTV